MPRQPPDVGLKSIWHVEAVDQGDVEEVEVVELVERELRQGVGRVAVRRA